MQRVIFLCTITVLSFLSLNTTQANESWLPTCESQVCTNLDPKLYQICEGRQDNQIPLVAGHACVCDCTTAQFVQAADINNIGKMVEWDVLPVIAINTEHNWYGKCQDAEKPFYYSVPDGWFIDEARFEKHAWFGEVITSGQLYGHAKILTWSDIHDAYDYAQGVLRQNVRSAIPDKDWLLAEINTQLEELRQQHIASRHLAGKTGFQKLSGMVYSKCSKKGGPSEMLRGYPVVTIQYVGSDIKQLKQVLAQFVKNEIAKRTRQIHSYQMD